MSYPTDKISHQGESAYITSALNLLNMKQHEFAKPNVKQPAAEVIQPPYSRSTLLLNLKYFPFEFKVLSNRHYSNLEKAEWYLKRAKYLSLVAIICGMIIIILALVGRLIVLKKYSRRD